MMDAVTYPNSEVVNFVKSHMIPLRVKWNTEPLASNFNVKWTPTVVLLDPEGSEHHRTIGYLPPEELIPALMLGTAKWRFDMREWERAAEEFDQIEKDYPQSSAAPEAVYLGGAARYEATHDFQNLRDAYRELQAKYPQSEWFKRAAPFAEEAIGARGKPY